MRELELLVANFDLEADSYRPRGSRSGDADDNKPLSPNVILDMIKHTLRIYKQQLEQTTSEVSVLHTYHLKSSTSQQLPLTQKNSIPSTELDR